jgi:SAM-dependent methyltransferase
VTLHEGYFPHPAVEGKKFDVVTLCDVIEHVSRPMELLQAAHRCLVPGGLLVLVTPDIRSFAARVMGHRWWHFRSAHIGYFSRQTMLAALESAGFQVEKIVPYTWWFPLGYVMKRLEAYLPLGFVNRLMGASRLWAVILKGSVPVNLRDSYVYFAKTSEQRPPSAHS